MVVFKIQVLANPLELFCLARNNDVVGTHDVGFGSGDLHLVVKTAYGQDGVLVLFESIGVLFVNLLQGHADKPVSGGDMEFQGQVFVTAVAQGGHSSGEKFLQGDDGDNSYHKAEQPNEGGSENWYRYLCRLILTTILFIYHYLPQVHCKRFMNLWFSLSFLALYHECEI